MLKLGGYVGLFLGVSVNQIINLMEHVILKIEQLQSDSWSDICTYDDKTYEFTTHITLIIYTKLISIICPICKKKQKKTFLQKKQKLCLKKLISEFFFFTYEKKEDSKSAFLIKM